MSRRVVVTGRGIVSCIGNTMDEVAAALRQGRSGIERVKEFADAGLRSEVAGMPDLATLPPVDRKLRRFMPDAALYAYHAACAAVAEARVSALLAHPRTGLIVGSGASPSLEMADTVALAREHGARKVLPYAVPRLMGNTTSANLATAFGTPKEEWEGHRFHDVETPEWLAWAPLLVLIVALGIYPNFVFEITDGGVQQALSAFTGGG